MYPASAGRNRDRELLLRDRTALRSDHRMPGFIDVVLGDESTGNLDSESGIGILMLLRDRSRQHGTTTLMVTHDPDATAYVNRVVKLRDGRIVADTGALPELGSDRGAQ